MPLGQSFSPTAADQTQNQNAQPNSLQDAIRILSFSIPRLVGAQGIAPPQLMGGPGGVPAMLQRWLQSLFGGQNNGIPLPGMPPGVPPMEFGKNPGMRLPLPGMPPGVSPAGPYAGPPPPGGTQPTPQGRPGAGPLPNVIPGQGGPKNAEMPMPPQAPTPAPYPGSYGGPEPPSPEQFQI